MPAYAGNVWSQLKGLKQERLIRALKKDGWTEEETGASTRAFVKVDPAGARLRRVVIHYHRGASYGPGLLKALLKDIGWTQKDLKRLKLIK